MGWEYHYSVDVYDTRDDISPDYKRSYVIIDESEHKYSFTDKWDLEDLAEKCADDYYSNHDGWDNRSWNSGSGLVFLIWEHSEKYHPIEVCIDYCPSFYSRVLKA